MSYYFQRPQSENDLQAYGGGKRWAIGDDMLVEQVRTMTSCTLRFRYHTNHVGGHGLYQCVFHCFVPIKVMATTLRYNQAGCMKSIGYVRQ